MDGLDFSGSSWTREEFLRALSARSGPRDVQPRPAAEPAPPVGPERLTTVLVLYYPCLESRWLKFKLKALVLDSVRKNAEGAEAAEEALSGALVYSGKRAWYVVQGREPAVSRLRRKALQLSDPGAENDRGAASGALSALRRGVGARRPPRWARDDPPELCFRLAMFSTEERVVQAGFRVYPHVGNTGNKALDNLLWWLRHPEWR